MAKIDIEIEKFITGFPDQLRQGIALSTNVNINDKKYHNFDKVVICGMGGSALPGDIIKTWQNELLKLNKNIIIDKNYNLPSDISKKDKSLIICISYSGNTEETISAYKQANNKNITTIAITSGGKLSVLAATNKKPFVLIPKGIPPRFALGFQLGALIGILQKTAVIPKNHVSLIIKEAKSTNYEVLRKKAENIAKSVIGYIPLIYASEKNSVLAYLFKINFNENTKIPAFMNSFPELDHNEFNSFASLSKKQNGFAKNFLVLLLKDSRDLPRIIKRMNVTKTFINKAGSKTIEIKLNQSSIFKKTFAALALGQWTSIFLAQEYNVNPRPTDLIEEFKIELNK